MLSNEKIRAKGLELLDRLHGSGAAADLIADMDGLCPDFVDMSVEWALGGITARPGLDLVTRELIVVAACATLGNAQIQLRAHCQAALHAGATREQVVEAILQLMFYAGGAAVRNALAELRDILGADGGGEAAANSGTPSTGEDE